jgi:microcystin-dependent protein
LPAGAGSPLTTKGDLYGYSTTNARLPVGNDYTMLVADSNQTQGLRYARSNPKDYVHGDFENASASGWTLYHSTLDSTSKLPNQTSASWTSAAGTLSKSIDSTTPLSQTYSIAYSSSAASTAGDMLVSSPMSLDRSDQSHTLQINMNYSVISGASNVTFAGSNSDSFGVAIYDYTNNAWISPTVPWIFVASSGVAPAIATFQTPANMTSFALAVYNLNASSGAFQFDLDDIKIGPQNYTVTVSGPVGQIIESASSTTPSGFLPCDGTAVSRSQYADLFVAIGTTYGVGDGSTTFNVPNLKGIFPRGAGSQTIGGISYSATLGQSQGDQMQGHLHGPPSGANNYFVNVNSGGDVFNGGGSAYRFNFGSSFTNTGGPINDGSNGTPRTGSETRPANVAVNYYIRYQANYQTSSQAGNSGPVVAIYNSTSGQTLTSGGIVNYENVTNDTNGAVTIGAGTWKFTCPSSGFYDVFTNLQNNSSATPSNWNLYLLKNGAATGVNSAFAASTGSFALVSLSGTVYCNATEYLQVASNNNTGNLNTGNNVISISKRSSGSQVFQATDTVSARYYTTTAQSIADSTDVTILYDTKDFNTNNGFYNTSTGIYTVGVSGKYSIQAKIRLALATLSGGRGSNFYIYKNGTNVSGNYFDYQVGTGSSSAGVSHLISDTLDLKYGDQIKFVVNSNNGTTRALDTVGTNNVFSITKVGN